MRGELWIIIAGVALVVGTILSALVQSLRDLSKATLEEIATIKGNVRAQERVRKIVDDPDGHASAIALPRIFLNLAVVIAIVFWIAGLRNGIDARPDQIDLLVGVITSTLLLWIFGNVLPASIAKHAAEGLVYAWSATLRVAYYVAAPASWVTRVFDELLRRLTGKADKNDQQAIEEELLSVVEEAKVGGAVDEVESDMIEAVVKFRSRTVAQVMTPRTEVEAMEVTTSLSEVTKAIRSIGHSRIPVYEGSLDHVVGVFYVKDLMRWLAGESSRSGKKFDLKDLLRPAVFVPESKTLRDLLSELLGRRVHIAIVADEYGGTAGIVTIEDIIEEVFGDIQDEYEQVETDEPEIKLDESKTSAEIDGRAYVEDVNSQLRSIGFELPESEDYDTVSGYVMVTLGRIPQAGESFALDGDVQVSVLRAEPTRVSRVRIGRMNAEAEAVQPTPAAQ